jgi:signal transduction histidine kinase/ActR/RegA family two-component response regulator
VRHRDRTWALELRVAPPIEARLYHSLVPYVVLAGLLIGLLAFVVIAHLDAVRARLTALIGDLREARLAAEVASEAKLLFLANMSHEIRTPLNGVLGTSGLLLECELSGEDRELAEAVRASACELHDRLELILDFVKVETDQLDLEAVELEPRKELETVVGLLAPWAASKRLTLRCELDAGLPAVILADARRLRQILFQIAGNAVKFTDQGEVVLRATLLSGREPEAEATLRFEVQDTGPGIPPAERERMLAAFAMRDATMTRRHRGLGLGLSLSHRLVRLMGGELDVTSASGRGTGIGFTLRRPVRRWRPGPSVEAAPALRPGDTSAPEATRPARGLRVLVVEDNPVNQRVTASVLRHAGHEVRTAETGTAAVSAVGEERFDVVLMDCQMPEMDGYEATRRIRALEEGGGRTPIIALTAHDLKGDRERCLRAGMDDYLAKPVSPERLLARIRAWTEAPLASVTL